LICVFTGSHLTRTFETFFPLRLVKVTFFTFPSLYNDTIKEPFAIFQANEIISQLSIPFIQKTSNRNMQKEFSFIFGDVDALPPARVQSPLSLHHSLHGCSTYRLHTDALYSMVGTKVGYVMSCESNSHKIYFYFVLSLFNPVDSIIFCHRL
jgi:hypothetical protein